MIEQHFLDFIQSHSPGQVEIVRPAKPVKLQVDESQFDEDDSYPITVEVERIQSNVVGGSTIASTPEVIHSKYLLGSDGAHSWVREQLGITMEGEQTELVWGVMDVIPITNFRKMKPAVQRRHLLTLFASGYPYALYSAQRLFWNNYGDTQRTRTCSSLHSARKPTTRARRAVRQVESQYQNHF